MVPCHTAFSSIYGLVTLFFFMVVLFCLALESPDLGTSELVSLSLYSLSVSVSAFKAQDQDQDSLLVKRRNDIHSPGPMIRELVPSSQQLVGWLC